MTKKTIQPNEIPGGEREKKKKKKMTTFKKKPEEFSEGLGGSGKNKRKNRRDKGLRGENQS